MAKTYSYKQQSIIDQGLAQSSIPAHDETMFRQSGGSYIASFPVSCHRSGGDWLEEESERGEDGGVWTGDNGNRHHGTSRRRAGRTLQQ